MERPKCIKTLLRIAAAAAIVGAAGIAVSESKYSPEVNAAQSTTPDFPSLHNYADKAHPYKLRDYEEGVQMIFRDTAKYSDPLLVYGWDFNRQIRGRAEDFQVIINPTSGLTHLRSRIL